MTVPAALATTIFILLMFSIVLVHQWEPRSTVRPDPPDDTPTPPLGTLVIYGAHWECWGGTRPEVRNPPNNQINDPSLPGGAE